MSRILTAIGMVAALAVGTTGSAMAQTKQLSIATGGTGGVYYPLAGGFGAILAKEFVQMRRDRLTFGMMAGIPMIQLVLFGFAINTDVKHLATAIFDQSRTQESREMISSFTSSNYFDVELYAHNIKEVNRAVESGKVKVALVFPPNYAQRLRSGRQAQGGGRG